MKQILAMNGKMLSQRIHNLTESATIKMTQYSQELKAQGIGIINLSIGEPDFNTPQHIKKAAKQAIDNNITHYSPVAGFNELRQAISYKLKRDNGLSFEMNQIVVSNGAKQSLANILLSVLNPGDEVIVPAPYWVSYPDIIRLAMGKVVPLKTTIQQGFKVRPEQIEAAITPKTKVFLLNSPSNPSGVVYSREELAGFVKLFEKYPDILIVSDEIYEHIRYKGRHHSIAAFKSMKDRVVVVNGVSKAFAMTGWRIGYMAAPSWLAGACSKLQGQITFGPSSISQMAALDALTLAPKKSGFLMEMVSTFRKRRDLTVQLIRQIEGVKTILPQGAFYLFPDVSYYFGKTDGFTAVENSTDLCLYLLDKAHVALVPGEAFGNPACVRLSYATDTNEIATALKRIKKVLAELKYQNSINK